MQWNRIDDFLLKSMLAKLMEMLLSLDGFIRTAARQFLGVGD
jgi:hypothetical protein